MKEKIVLTGEFKSFGELDHKSYSDLMDKLVEELHNSERKKIYERRKMIIDKLLEEN